MPLAANLTFHDYQFQIAVQQGQWKWTTRMDVSQSAPFFEIRDIISPFGLLRDSTPIPGDVVQAMSESIDELQAQFPPNILLSPASLIFNVDEGRGLSLAQSVIVTNDGIYGSLLSVSLATSAAYLLANPGSLGNLAFQEGGEFDVSVDSTDLIAANSPINETITVQDVNASNTPQTITVTINVQPQATIDVSPTTLDFTVAKPLTPPFPGVPTQQFTVTNTGPVGSVLQYQIQKLTCLSEKWLKNFSPVSGTLNDGESEIITVTVVPDFDLQPGTFTETLRVSGFSTNDFVDVIITLVIT